MRLARISASAGPRNRVARPTGSFRGSVQVLVDAALRIAARGER